MTLIFMFLAFLPQMPARAEPAWQETALAAGADELINGARALRPTAPAWRIARNGGANAAVIAGEGASLDELARLAGLDAKTWQSWLSLLEDDHSLSMADARFRGIFKKKAGAEAWDISVNDEFQPGTTFYVPNTVIAVWLGDLGALGKTIVGWKADIQHLRDGGFQVQEEETADGATSRVLEDFRRKFLHGIFVTGHGSPDGNISNSSSTEPFPLFRTLNPNTYNYRLGLVILNVCYGQRTAPHWVSENGRFLASEGVLVPPFETHSPRELKFPRVAPAK